MEDLVRRFSASVVACLVAAILVPVPNVSAQVGGTSYTISPLAGRIFWDDEAGLADGYFYGGDVGFGFGEYLELSGQYVIGTFETDFSGLTFDNGVNNSALADLDTRDVDLTRYGAKLRVNLGTSGLKPFITAGTGILRFDPVDVDPTESIYATAGLGINLTAADRYALVVLGELLGYRYNPGRTLLSSADLAQLGMFRDDFSQRTVVNPSVTAALRVYLGGRAPGQLTDLDRALVRQMEGGGLALAIEPFYGQVDFNDALGGFPGRQTFAGVNAGVDLGPRVGVRGFYWRGTDDDELLDLEMPEGFRDIQMFGGELHLRFASELGGGLLPYLILGGGYLDVNQSSYSQQTGGFAPDDRYFATGGAGIEIPLAQALRLQGGVRGLFMSNEDVENLNQPSDVFGSLMYSLGLNFNIGGDGRRPGEVYAAGLEEERRERQRAVADVREQTVERERELRELETRLDSLSQIVARAQAGDERAVERLREEQRLLEEERRRRERQRLGIRDDAPEEERRRSYVSGRTMEVPIPEEGEIYIRFGGSETQTTETIFAQPSAGVVGGQAAGDQLSATEIREIVRQTIREQIGGAGASEFAGEDQQALFDRLSEIESRLDRRLSREIALMRDEVRRLRAGGDDVTIIDRGTGDTGAVRVQRTQDPFGGIGGPSAWMPYLGTRFGSGDAQFVVGLRGDYGATGLSNFRFMPEATLGLSGGSSLALIANGVAFFGDGVASPLRPYAGAGVGVGTGFGLGINLLGGAEYVLQGGPRIFAEFSTLDFFGQNRLLLGARLGL